MLRKIAFILSLLLFIGTGISSYLLHQKIADGEQQYAAGLKQYAAGQQQLKSGKARLAKGKQQLAAAKGVYTIASSTPFVGVRNTPIVNNLYKDAGKKIAAGDQQVAVGEKKVKSGEAQLAAGKKALSAGAAQLAFAKQVLFWLEISCAAFFVLTVFFGVACCRRKREKKS